MDLLALLLKAYFAVEGIYYKACDFLQKLRLPVYSLFVNPIEKRGVPSFIAFLFVLFVVIIGAWTYFSTASASSQATDVQVIVYGPSGDRLDDATVTLLKGAREVASGTTYLGVVYFPGIEYGAEFSVRAEKQGYEPASQKMFAGGNQVFRVTLELARQ